MPEKRQRCSEIRHPRTKEEGIVPKYRQNIRMLYELFLPPVRMQLPVTAAVHMTKKQAHHGLLPASELRKGQTMAQKQKLQNSGMQIPDDAILSIAQAMLPLMQQYFESEEGRLQLSGQTEALEQKEAAPASQPAPPLIYFLRCFRVGV